MPAPARPSASREDSHGLRIKGGSRGLTVEYRELEAAGGKLEEVVEQLGALRERGVGVCLQLYWLPGPNLFPEAADRAADAVNAAVLSLRSSTEELEEAARGLRKAGANYLDVEGRLETAFTTGPALSAAAAAASWGSGGRGYPNRAVAENLVPQYDGLAIKALLVLLARGNYGKLRPVNVSRVDGNHGNIPAPGTARELLDRSRRLQQTQQEGVVEVLSMETRAGRQVRVVTLPGTQPGGLFVGGNPFDQYGNAEGRAEDSKYVAAAVAEALRQAGTSADAAVILVGYSQGGIHAVNTGARLAEGGEFNVEMILTAGSPAGDRDIPPDVKVLHLEHNQDWIAGMDGASNPDTPDRITVTGTAPVPDGGGPLGPAHELDGYLEMAAGADASNDPSLRDSLGQLAEIIPPGTIATRNLFRFSRRSDSRPARSGKSPAGGKRSGQPQVCPPQVHPAVPAAVLPVPPIPVPPIPVPEPVPPIPVPEHSRRRWLPPGAGQ